MLKELKEKYKTKTISIEDWQKIGLIRDNLAIEQKIQVSELLESILSNLIERDSDEILKFALPLVVKVYTNLVDIYSKQIGLVSTRKFDLEIYNLINTRELLQDFDIYWSKTLDELKRYKYIDSEAYFIQIFSENFVLKLLKQLVNKSPEEIVSILRQKKLEKII